MLAPVPPAQARARPRGQEAVTYLRARSTDLKIALDQVLQAEAQTRIALAQYLPEPDVDGRHVTTSCSTSSGIYLSSSGARTQRHDASREPAAAADPLNVQQFDQISIDELNEDATRLSVDDKKRTLALSLANQIVAVVTAERSADINRVGLKVALEQLEITRRKQALGAANGLDVVRAEQNAANARAALVSGDESLREAREALGLALGLRRGDGRRAERQRRRPRAERRWRRAASSTTSTSAPTSPRRARTSTSPSATCGTSTTSSCPR